MLARIRNRLTLGYIGIFALILLVLGAVVVTSFWEEVAAQQDEVLAQKAQGASDFMKALLHRYSEGKPNPGEEDHNRPSDAPVGPLQSSTEPDIGVIAVIPPDDTSNASTVLDASPSASNLGLPFEELAQRAAQEGKTITQTVKGPEDENMRVVSISVTGPEDDVGVVQVAQARQVVWETVSRLVLILVPVGLVGLLLAGVGGLYMSRRALRPVRDSFQRQRTFIADASHELKTPLSLISINADVMKRNPTDPENKEVIDDQLSEISRMDTLLSDLLVLARLDAGKLDVEDKPFDLAAVMAETSGRFLARASEEGVQLEVEVREELPVRGDPGRTSQILAALLDNAMRYTPKGGTITLSGRLLDGWVEASVTDTGPGISLEHLPNLFERFYRAEAARTRQGGGTGLGLSISRELAHAQGGELTAENVSEGDTGGARFRLRLPRNRQVVPAE
jgi:signal transduction histidine kinase